MRFPVLFAAGNGVPPNPADGVFGIIDDFVGVT
jgi:hypothetical protein